MHLSEAVNLRELTLPFMARFAIQLPVARAVISQNKVKKKIKTKTFVSQNVRGMKSSARIEEHCSCRDSQQIRRKSHSC